MNVDFYVIQYIHETYQVLPEYLWAKNPQCCIFRHQHNRKWFAVLMRQVSASKLNGTGLPADVDLLNLKCDPELSQMILIDHQTIFPAYHMNKKHWISVVLNQCQHTHQIEELKNLLAHSFQKTS